MRVCVTGATGFIGGRIARELAARGDEVVALVRSPEKAGALRDAGIKLVTGDLHDLKAIDRALDGAEAAIHGAAVYEVGIRDSEREPMRRTNVDGTRNVLEAIKRAGTPKAVYVSTIGVYGDTHGQVVDETHTRPPYGFLSYYEETKFLAHELAKELIEDGLPLAIVMPGFVYGPKDHSAVGDVLMRFAKGHLPVLPFASLGFNAVHRDDVVAGTLLALDAGRPGQSYHLGGEITTMKDTLKTAAAVLGRRAPLADIPDIAMRATAPLGPLVGPLLGFPPNLNEAVRASAGVTYWGAHSKAVRELGYAPRALEQGLRELFVAEGRLS